MDRCCPDLDLSESRNKICSLVAGGLFSVAWWLAIDASVTDPDNTKDLFHLCGVFSFLSMLMVNMVSNGQLRGESYTDGMLGIVAAKIWFFFGFLMGFGALMGSLVIFFGEYLSTDSKFTSVIPGVQFVLQNVGILASSLVYRFGRSEDMWG